MKRRGLVIFLILACITPLMFAGGIKEPSTETEVSKRGGILVGALHYSPATLDPHRASGQVISSHLIFNSLFRWDKDENGIWGPQPELAVSWEQDGKVLIIKLRENVKFHDGSDFDAEVVKFNIERMQDADGTVLSTAKDNVQDIESVEVIDKYTVKLNLKYPTSFVCAKLSDSANSRPYMVSMKGVKEKGDVEYGNAPAGTGPMRVVEFVKDSHVTLERTGSYWELGDDGLPLPYVDQVKIRFIADSSVKAIELRSGTLDFSNYMNSTDLLTLQKLPNLKFNIVEWQGTKYRMNFGLAGGKFGNNKLLRQAALYAIDKEAIARILGEGLFGVAGKYHVAPDTLGYDPSIPYYSYNPEKAKQLLKDAGYSNGLDVKLVCINRVNDVKMVQMIKQQLDQVGIRTTLEVLERAAYLDVVRSGNFDMSALIVTYRNTPDGDLNMIFGTGQRTNYTKYSNPEIDKMFTQAAIEADPAKQQQLYVTIQKKLMEEAIDDVIWVAAESNVQNAKVHDIEIDFEGFWRVRRAWIEK